MPGIGSSSPAVLIAHLAAATSRIRVGSGGVMLPNHQPLVVAEQFGTLEALHPGRIDLGIGRAPGTDPRTAAALRRGTDPLGADDFPEQLTELVSYFHGDGPVLAVPAVGHEPAVWLLGSSGYSAQVAGLLGLPFAFAHHFSGHNTMAALQLYRQTFRPSAVLSEPYPIIAAAVLAAETDAEARRLAMPSALQFLQLRLGRPGLVPSPEEAAAYPYSDEERAFIEDRLAGQVIGAPETVRDGVRELVERTGVAELMVVTNAHDGADRLRSYELLAAAVTPARI
jgi:luciferase family oxidoreductase group 1